MNSEQRTRLRHLIDAQVREGLKPSRRECARCQRFLPVSEFSGRQCKTCRAMERTARKAGVSS